MPVSLQSFGAWLGTARDLSGLGFAGERSIATLERGGFERFMESELDVPAMAAAAARASLDARPPGSAQIGHVMVVSESLWDQPRSAPAGRHPHLNFRDAMLRHLVEDAGLTDAQVHGSWMSGCGNLVPALALARGLAGTGETVLLLCADRASSLEKRLLPGGQAVFSDVAAACVVSDRPGPLLLRHSATHISLEMLKAQRSGNYLAVALELRTALARLDEKVQALTGSRIRDIGPVVTENLNALLVASCCQSIGVDAGRVHSPTRAQIGHAYSADLLLSLEAMVADGGLPRESSLVALSLSSWCLGAAVLQLA